MRRVAVTGASGFLGWHLRVLAEARGDVDVVALDREACSDIDMLARAIDGCERVVHLAGVNRGTDDQVRSGNAQAASQVGAALRSCDAPPAVVVANSTQYDNGSVYGNAKSEAADALHRAADLVGAGFADVRLPNIFGEHGRPYYNSVVATFCHQLAAGELPAIEQDRELDLLHARNAAAALLDVTPSGAAHMPAGERITVSGVLRHLTAFAKAYDRAEFPALTDDFRIDLFNTYRSFCAGVSPVASLQRNVDPRGELVEAVKVHGGTGQCFFSTSVPGVTRGQHYHLRKVERFVVLQGEATISLRRKLTSEVVTHKVTGDDAVAVDMPTMWVHNITNVGSGPLLTLFWTNDLFDPTAPDTYPEPV